MEKSKIIERNNIKLHNLPASLHVIAEVIGLEQTLRLCRELGGEQFYIPKLSSLISSPNLKQRDQKIFKEFNGRNAMNLARKYGITSRRIYYIIQKEKVKINE